MSRLQHLHKNVRKFLKKEGYILPQRHDVIERKMRSLMEPSRYEKYLDIGDDMRAGLVGVSKLYQTVLTLEEAHLLFSHQSGLISETMVSIIDLINNSDHMPIKIADMGCSTGSFCRLLHDYFSNAEVYGFDCETVLLNLASTTDSSVNFQEWDYLSHEKPTDVKFDVIVSSFGIDFPHIDKICPLDIYDYKEYKHYEMTQSFVKPIFKNWRSVSTEDSQIFSVLRVPQMTEFMAVVNSASASGWHLDITKSDFIYVHDERVTALVFSSESFKYSDDDYCSWWIEKTSSIALANVVLDEPALVLYNQLSPKEIISEEERKYEDGHIMRSVVAKCGTIGIHFQKANAGYCKIELCPAYQVINAAPRFPDN
jgi:hypothetical protein